MSLTTSSVLAILLTLKNALRPLQQDAAKLFRNFKASRELRLVFQEAKRQEKGTFLSFWTFWTKKQGIADLFGG